MEYFYIFCNNSSSFIYLFFPVSWAEHCLFIVGFYGYMHEAPPVSSWCISLHVRRLEPFVISPCTRYISLLILLWFRFFSPLREESWVLPPCLGSHLFQGRLSSFRFLVFYLNFLAFRLFVDKFSVSLHPSDILVIGRVIGRCFRLSIYSSFSYVKGSFSIINSLGAAMMVSG